MFSLMLKPASSACNLRCAYCFYASLSRHRSSADRGLMTEETAQRLITEALAFAKDGISFVFQGGEPMLAGLPFYRRFVTLVQEHNTKNIPVSYCMQTNATRIDGEWCAFFRENRFLVGVSLDGDEQLHSYRVYPDGRNSFSDVMHGISLLEQYKIDFNILCVVTKRTANNFRQSYRFFKEHNWRYLQYIPCLPTGEADNTYTMSVTDYETFLHKACRLYYNSILDGSPVSIRQFDNYRLMLSGRPAEQCGMNGLCTGQAVAESDGCIYPCDFYCTDGWYLGNIHTQSLADILLGEKAKSFLQCNPVQNENCRSCAYENLCHGGGCRRMRECFDYCGAYRSFFAENISLLSRLK